MLSRIQVTTSLANSLSYGLRIYCEENNCYDVLINGMTFENYLDYLKEASGSLLQLYKIVEQDFLPEEQIFELDSTLSSQIDNFQTGLGLLRNFASGPLRKAS